MRCMIVGAALLLIFGLNSAPAKAAIGPEAAMQCQPLIIPTRLEPIYPSQSEGMTFYGGASVERGFRILLNDRRIRSAFRHRIKTFYPDGSYFEFENGSAIELAFSYSDTRNVNLRIWNDSRCAPEHQNVGVGDRRVWDLVSERYNGHILMIARPYQPSNRFFTWRDRNTNIYGLSGVRINSTDYVNSVNNRDNDVIWFDYARFNYEIEALGIGVPTISGPSAIALVRRNERSSIDVIFVLTPLT
jgi:hypothetical protein